MLIPSCLFRLGGTACVLTNRPAARFSAKCALAAMCSCLHVEASELVWRSSGTSRLLELMI